MISRRMAPARVRLIMVGAGVVFSALALVACTQPWFSFSVTAGNPITTTGQTVASGLSGLAIAAMALAAALTIARRVLRVVLGVIEVGLGVAIAGEAIGAIAAPVAAGSASISASTGLSGSASVNELVLRTTSTIWPEVAVVAGISIVVAGVLIVVTASFWPGPTQKFERSTSTPPAADVGQPARTESPVGAWDALSSGADPTSPAPRQ